MDPPKQPTAPPEIKTERDDKSTRHQRRAARRRHVKQTLRRLSEQEEIFFDTNITIAEDTRTSMAKNDLTNAKRVTIDNAHEPSIKPAPSLMQQGRNLSYRKGTSLRRAI